jgi:Fic family protein
MRTYEKTHPWITFQVNLKSASARLWMNLGEASSKCEHIAGVPLRPSVAQELHQLYLAKGVLGTTAIEGNTLTEDQVRQILDGTLKLPPSKEYLQQEIENVLRACNQIGTLLAASLPVPLTVAKLKEFNAIVLDKLKVEPEVIPGQIRTHSVGVLRYRGAPAEDCEYLLQRLCDWLNGDDFNAPSSDTVVYAIIKAVLAHLYLAWIHPFGDGNGRTARLVEFQLLLTAGVPSPAAHLMSNHYNHTRTEYYRQLDYASKSGGDILPFMEYAVQGFVDGLRGQLELVREQQWDVTWRNYVHEMFRDKIKVSDIRQRHLALDLSAIATPVPLAKITETTPRLAKTYATKSPKTLQRDLAELEKLGIVERTAEGIRAKREIILAFLPLRANANSPASQTPAPPKP